jgi:hypothetical protein
MSTSKKMLPPVPASCTPGSVEAVKRGCNCNLDRNNGGTGSPEDVHHEAAPGRTAHTTKRIFYYTEPDCPVHGIPD